MSSSTVARSIDHTDWHGRVEDNALLRGAGRFGDDLKPEGALAAFFVRSPHAHAKISRIDVTAAKAAPGVVAVITGADLAGEHFHSLSHAHPIPGRGGKTPYSPDRPSLAQDRVMHVGEPVAMVIAKSAAQAQDAGEKIEVDYETLTPVTDAREAVKPGAPQLWPDAPGNVGFDWTAPQDPDGKKNAALEKAFAEAAHVVKVELVNQRLVVASLEPRAATASFDLDKNRYDLRCGNQGFAGLRAQICEAMNIKPDELHVVAEDVGGAFGMKGWLYPEYVPMLYAARKLKKPVHWVSTRSEAFLTDNQGRDSFYTVELALSKRGKFLGLRVGVIGNMGAYFTGVAHFVVTLHISGCLPTVYDIPHAQVNARCVFTNTLPTGPYRGAGRPEASYLLERVIDAAAQQTGIDAAELRRRNLIQPEQMPYTTAFGSNYDSGNFPAIFERALARADYEGFAARKKAAKKQGKLRGIGLGCYLEIAGAWPEESARISFASGGRIDVSIGSGASGQGHQTVFGNVVARRLGVPFDSVKLLSGDSARDVPGFGAVASRSAMMCGGAIARTTDLVLEKGKRVAAMLLQAEESEVAYKDGKFAVKNREVTLFEVAERAAELARQGVVPESLDTTGSIKVPPSFPNGCHVVEVEIDAETGALAIVNYVAVGDCGNVLDETIVEGQVHGGVAQGLGQALTENTVYDDSGQLVSASFMDYGMPRADTMPSVTVEHFAIACKTNPLGTKGTGEAGTTAAPPALMNAVLDAMPQGVQLDMPATSDRVWRALQSGK
ncbi:xanthine dehydrogenase family protein molybdopterin-binding subunit [Microbacteriaceae bacterium K1510]|nr:xanthine dehydrogenase family protein molybdopterin-binding subunit [Microbacteriaceae bacterium K1510]